jgi:hypothetical protein
MRNPLLPLLIILLCFDCYGQKAVSTPSNTKSEKASRQKTSTKKCALEYAQMPLVNGVRIGMPYDGVKSVYPEIETNKWFQKKYRIDKSGLFMVSAAEISNPGLVQDLEQISLNFENDEIRDYDFIYKPEKWNSGENMLNDLTEVFNVNSESWIIFPTALQMNCRDFVVFANHLPSAGKIMNSMNSHKK